MSESKQVPKKKDCKELNRRLTEWLMKRDPAYRAMSKGRTWHGKRREN